MNKVRWCPRPGLSPRLLARALLAGERGSSGWFDRWIDSNTHLTHMGRTAIQLLFGSLNLTGSDEVLLPSYSCGSEIEAIRQSGPQQLRFYRVDSRARINLEHLKSCLNARTRVIYVTHYFGWRHDLSEIIRLAADHQALLVEDCALALFSQGLDSPQGLEGHAGIFSFAKSINCPDGGALVLREEPGLITWKPTPAPTVRVWRSCAVLVLMEMVNQLASIWPAPWTRLARNAIPESAFADTGSLPKLLPEHRLTPELIGRSMSRISAKILGMSSFTEALEGRRRNFQLLSECVNQLESLEPLFDGLPDTVCPLCFPVRVRHRPWWMLKLTSKGVRPIGWWASFHPLVDWSQFPEACELKRSILALPVDHDLTGEQIDYIASVLTELDREAPS